MIRGKKARLSFDTYDKEYIKIYKEREDITRIKLKEMNVPNDLICEIIQLRMDNIHLRNQLEKKKRMLSDIGMNPFELPPDIPT